MDIIPQRKRLTLPNKSILTLTADQSKAVDIMLEWAKGNELTFTLTGAAGTGKTTCLKTFISNCNRIIGVSAPTHKAVSVVSKSVGRTGKTIQSLLGLRPNTNIENFDIANPQFDPRGNKSIQNFNIVIIDEASMLNKDIQQLIESEAMQYKVKILYVGDKYQLPPVNEKESRVFRNKNIFELKEIIRQGEDNPLRDLLEILRSDIDKMSSKFISYLKSKKLSIVNDKGFAILSKKEFEGEIITEFNSETFISNVDFCRFTSYTNENVLLWNHYIRNKIHNNPKESLIIDDLLIGYTTLIDEFNNLIIVNSEDYIVDSIKNYVSEFDIKGYIVTFQSIHFASITPGMFVVDYHNKEGFKNYAKILQVLHNEAYFSNVQNRSKNWKRYYSFKDRNLSLLSFILGEHEIEIPIEEDNSKYFDTTKKRIFVKKDIDYGYGLTVHKTQGSTYNNIFVNLKNILYNKEGKARFDIKLRNQLAYVAISRAKNKSIILL